MYELFWQIGFYSTFCYKNDFVITCINAPVYLR